MAETSVIERTVAAGRGPATEDSLVADLAALGVRPGMNLLVHCAMSKLGFVVGEGEAVVAALTRALGPDGTLVMPTMSSGRSEPSHWQHPPVPEDWWPILREHMPAFDPRTTPGRMMGAVSECFRTWRGVLRSTHPTNSFAARGPQAAFVTDGHQLAESLGDPSPLARVYDLEGHVLLIGVGHANDTSLHLAEYRADYPGKKTSMLASPTRIEGRRQWVEYEDLDLIEDDFETIGADFAEKTGLQVEGELACARALLCPQVPLVDHAVVWMEANRKH